MDGSAADGEDPFFSALFLIVTVVIQRLQRAGGSYQDGPSAEKVRQEDGYEEVGQEVQVPQEDSKEGRQEGGPEILGQENRQKISSQIGQEERQAREIGPEELCPEAGKVGWPVALAAD